MKYRILLLCLLFFGGLFLLLQQTNAYHFFFMEQNQLFLFTADFFRERVAMPGGLALYLGDFLSQFFYLPYAGAAVTAGLLTLIVLMTALICLRMIPKVPLYLLYIIPATLLLFLHFTFNYFVQGTVAFLLMLFFFYGYTCIKSFGWRLGYTLGSVLLLYITGGAIVNLFALCILLWEILDKKEKKYWFALPVLFAVGLSIWGYATAVVAEWRFAFLPDAYYNRRIYDTPAVLYFAWISFPVLLIATRFFKTTNSFSRKKEIITTLLQAGLIAALFIWGVPKYDDVKSKYLKKLDYDARQGRWDKIIDEYPAKSSNYLYLSYLNMALAEKGQLAERAFSFDQQNVNGLIINWNKTASVSALLSHIYYTIGNIALAQQMAFESNISTMGGTNPYMVQRLVQTNLIYGAYPVAEKYIDMLSNTLFYKEWAEEHRRFLYNDAALEQDPILGAKRKNLVDDSFLSLWGYDFIAIAGQNPANKAPAEYLGVSHLLAKDVLGFKDLVETYYGTPLMPVLPRSYQEALIVFSENDPEYWKRFDIPEAMILRFQEYKKQVLANRNSGNLPNLLRRSFGDTYWFFYMFK